MADTDIDAIRKQKRAERNNQYRLKCKMEMQQQASTPSETELAESKRRKSEYNKQYQLKRKNEMQQSETELKKRKKSESNRQQYPVIIHVYFLSCDRSTGSCICPCRQNITDTHKRHIHDLVLLSQDRNYTCIFFFYHDLTFIRRRAIYGAALEVLAVRTHPMCCAAGI